jgi:hypothetical protein
MLSLLATGAVAAALTAAGPGDAAQRPEPSQPPLAQVQLSAVQLFALSDAALAAGDTASAEAALTALMIDPVLANRNEARFRLASLRAGTGRLTDAAILLRQILDEEPSAQRARLELAGVLNRMGDEAGARRALREAQAAGLPLEIAQRVDGYVAQLRSHQRLGGAVEVAFGPDSNTNQATASDRLGTVFGDLVLDADARRRPGAGVSLNAEAFARADPTGAWNLLARVSANSQSFRAHQFDVLHVRASAGPEVRVGALRLTIQAGAGRRYFGGSRFLNTSFVTADLLRPTSRRSQLRLSLSAERIDNMRNALQDGREYSATLGLDYALSSSSGVGGSLTVDRQALRDPAYSSISGDVSAFAYRSVGRATLIGAVSHGRFRADDRLFIYPQRRSDSFYKVAVSVTQRRLTLAGFAPLVRLTLERNDSSLGLYSYRRARADFGINRAF